MSQDFDDFIMVDWSASSSPSPKNPEKGDNSVWLASIHGEPLYFRTREEFFEKIKLILAKALKNNQRVLCGFDFCFGLPAGAVAKLRKATNDNSNIPHWHWLWQYLDCQIKDNEGNKKNRNNRFKVASEMNRLLNEGKGGKGPFWGYQGKEQPDYLGTKKDKTVTGSIEFPERRKTENGNMGLSVWQLAYVGAVGGQSLMGLPYLHRLRFCCEGLFGDSIRVFPFEDCDSANIVIAESYYGRSDLIIDESIKPKDKAQVMAAVEFCRERQDDGRLASELLSRPAVDEILHDEGWTFTEPKPENMSVLKS